MPDQIIIIPVLLLIGGALVALTVLQLTRLFIRVRRMGCVYCAYDVRDQAGRCLKCGAARPEDVGFEVLPLPKNSDKGRDGSA